MVVAVVAVVRRKYFGVLYVLLLIIIRLLWAHISPEVLRHTESAGLAVLWMSHAHLAALIGAIRMFDVRSMWWLLVVVVAAAAAAVGTVVVAAVV